VSSVKICLLLALIPGYYPKACYPCHDIVAWLSRFDIKVRQRGRPGDILMDLLRGMPPRGRSVKTLVEWGRLFDISENVVRVTLSRLLARGLVECPTRGRYRLAAATDAVNDFVDRWRLGEERVRRWDNLWLMVVLTEHENRSLWALESYGFRAVRDGVHIRPDNLNLSPDDLIHNLQKLGLTDAATLITGRPVDDKTTKQWFALWQPEQLNVEYRSTREALVESTARLREMSRDEAMLESFNLGGEGIHLLAKDPLLPPPAADVTERSALWEVLIKYDALGKAIWASGSDVTLTSLPRPGVSNS